MKCTHLNEVCSTVFIWHLVSLLIVGHNQNNDISGALAIIIISAITVTHVMSSYIEGVLIFVCFLLKTDKHPNTTHTHTHTYSDTHTPEKACLVCIDQFDW